MSDGPIDFKAAKTIKKFYAAEEASQLNPTDALETCLTELKDGKITVDHLIVCCYNEENNSAFYYQAGKFPKTIFACGLLDRIKLIICGAIT